MRHMPIVVVAVIMLAAQSRAGTPPRVIKSSPADGARDVPVDIGQVTVVFDRNMKMNAHSLVEVPDVQFPPMVHDDDPWQDPVTFVLRLERLQPNTTYAIQLNSDHRKGFASAFDQTPLVATRVSFRTAGVGPSASRGTTAVPPTAGGPRGSGPPLVYRKMWEPNQRAFSFLAPDGWKVEGGMFYIDPMQTNGPGNTLEPKCDLTIKKDAAGTVMLHYVPSYNYADLTASPQFAMGAGFFPWGSYYQGMLVKPLPTVEAFLEEVFSYVHPQVRDAKTVDRKALPELVAFERKVYETSSMIARQMGLPDVGIDAGLIVKEYAEGGVRYKEALACALIDLRMTAAMWCNQYTLRLRSPAAEAERWRPVLDQIRQSTTFNPQWLAQVQQAVAQRGQNALETQRYINRVDQEIWEHRANTNAEIRHEDYLFLSGQEEYVNPFTKQVEQDTNEYKYRWTNHSGDMIYSDDNRYDPNKIRELNNVEWKMTPVRER